MLSHADLYTRSVQAVYVVSSSELSSLPILIKAVFVRLRKQTHRHPAIQSPQDRITDTDIREAIHRHIDLLCLSIDLCDRTYAVILGWILIG